MIGNLTLGDLALLVGLWFLTSMVANLFWTRFVLLKYTGTALMDWLNRLEDNPKGQEAVNKFLDRVFSYAFDKKLEKLADWFFGYMFEHPIKTGKKISVPSGQPKTVKDPDGSEHTEQEMTEVDEVVTPMDLIGRRISDYALMKMKGSAGGVKGQLSKMMEQSIMESGGAGLSLTAAKELRRGNLGPALAEVGWPYLKSKLNKSGNNTSTGGQKDW